MQLDLVDPKAPRVALAEPAVELRARCTFHDGEGSLVRLLSEFFILGSQCAQERRISVDPKWIIGSARLEGLDFRRHDNVAAQAC